MMAWIRILILLICAGCSAACGFHLKGMEAGFDALQMLWVEAPEGRLTDRLMMTFKSRHVKAERVPAMPKVLAEGEILLKISSLEWTEKTAGFSRDMRVAQARYLYTVRYEIYRPSCDPLLQTLNLEGDVAVDPNQLLGQGTLREKLKREVEQEAALQIVRSLWAIWGSEHATHSG